MEEKVILVNENDEIIGFQDKIGAHISGSLHRAFSIFVFNRHGEMLIQKRAETKYHSSGLWSNTCCGHPHPYESIEEATHRRLREEMGFDCELREIFHFIYLAKLGDLLYEHEYDHVFFGEFNGEPAPSNDEVAAWKWVNVATLISDVRANPEHYTYWFRLCLDQVSQLSKAE